MAKELQVLKDDYEFLKSAAEEFVDVVKDDKLDFHIVGYYETIESSSTHNKKDQFEICLFSGSSPIASIHASAAVGFDIPIRYWASLEMNPEQVDFQHMASTYINYMRGLIPRTKLGALEA